MFKSLLINLLQFLEISLITSAAYFLVIHGSRNRKTHIAAAKLKQLIALKIESKNIIAQANYANAVCPSLKSKKYSFSDYSKTPLVEIAALELAPLSLRESLVKFALKAESQGYSRVKVLPLFLAPGVHVREDIPIEIKLAIKQIKERVTIELSPFLGKYSETIDLLADKFKELSSSSQILVAHGSRMPEVKDYYQDLKTKLNVITAYWFGSPSLTQQIEMSIAAGQTDIGIVPYFLFPGKITETIATEVVSLQAEYPGVNLRLAEPLGATEALAELIARKIEQ